MKKVVAGFLTAALGLGLLASCGGSTETTKSAESKPSVSESENMSEKDTTKADEKTMGGQDDMTAELTWWSFPVFATVDGETGKYEKQLVEKFNKKYPNVKVHVEMIDWTSGPEKITTAIQGNTAPDVLFDAPGRIISYAKAGKLAKLNDLFTDEYKKDVDNKNILGACSDGKDYYMYPLSSAPFVMAVDKKALTEAGVWDKVPQTGERLWDVKTFTEVNEAAKNKGKLGPIAFAKNQGGDQGTRAFVVNLYGAKMTNDNLTEYTMDTDAAVKALEYIQKNVEEGTLTNGISYNGGDAIEQFVNGVVSQCLLWSPGLAKNQKEKYEAAGVEPYAVTFPTSDGKPNLEYLVNGFAIFDNGDAEKVKAAKAFLTFLCDDDQVGVENVKATNAFPVRQSFGDLYEGNEDMKFYGSLTKYYGTYYNTIDGYANMRPLWYNMLQELQNGGQAKELAEKFNEAANKTIKDAQ